MKRRELNDYVISMTAAAWSYLDPDDYTAIVPVRNTAWLRICEERRALLAVRDAAERCRDFLAGQHDDATADVHALLEALDCYDTEQGE